MFSKKGTEKPIEIFVALFVILAVALVMLKLFQSQITEKQKQLSDFEQEQKARELQQKVALHCQNKCTEASNNGCSLQALAAVCLSGSHQVLDSGEFLDFNGNTDIDFDIENFGGEGVCEDQVYCFSTIDSCCAREISVESCARILKDYWTQKQFDTTQQITLCGTIRKGQCSPSSADLASLGWWNSLNYVDASGTQTPLCSSLA